MTLRAACAQTGRYSRGVILSTAGILVLALTGCSGGDGNSSAVTNPASPSSEALLQAYNAYWDAILKASNPPDPDARILRAHASGVELHRAVEAIKARKKAGERLSGTYAHAAKVTSTAGNTATVTDCLTSNVVVKTNRQGGAGIPAVTGKPTSIVVLLVNDQQTWKVNRIEAGSASCPA